MLDQGLSICDTPAYLQPHHLFNITFLNRILWQLKATIISWRFPFDGYRFFTNIFHNHWTFRFTGFICNSFVRLNSQTCQEMLHSVHVSSNIWRSVSHLYILKITKNDWKYTGNNSITQKMLLIIRFMITRTHYLFTVQ